eukprot:TRINITY_DN1328_c0_g1_i1.p1 TRINITY_DN1328_c0_g1~~TRINITY_DN1328_c0_g1_i1.p1  ORF type:complete len:152 (+),score=20.08 TRINITY_DN1328_c0_g1_i1:3-458(+)
MGSFIVYAPHGDRHVEFQYAQRQSWDPTGGEHVRLTQFRYKLDVDTEFKNLANGTGESYGDPPEIFNAPLTDDYKLCEGWEQISEDSLKTIFTTLSISFEDFETDLKALRNVLLRVALSLEAVVSVELQSHQRDQVTDFIRKYTQLVLGQI